MSVETNISLVREWVEQVWNMGDLDSITHYHPPIFQNEGEASNIAQAQAWHQQMRTTYPDLRYTIEDIFAVEDRIALRWTAIGTHRGSLWGMIPPTQKEISWRGIHLLRIKNDQVVEVWALADTSAQLQQMGVQLQPS